jgi:hypothetical protein
LDPTADKSDRSIYLLGGLFGIVAGFVDLKFADLLLTALLVLASTMLLAMLRSQRPWRWTLLVAAFVPILQFVAYLLLTKKPERAQIYESFLGFLTGIAGAYGGSLARRALQELRKE